MKDQMSKERELFIILRVVVFIIVIAAGIGVFFLFEHLKPEPKEKKFTEMVKNLSGIPVKLGDVKLSISGFGKAQALQNILISSEVKGKIVDEFPHLKIGRLVNKGDVLLKIDPSDYESDLKQAEADLKQQYSERDIALQFIADTEKQLKAIKRVQELQTENFKRIRGLLKKRASFRTELEQAEIVMQNQAEKVINTNAALAKAKLQLESIAAKLRRAQAEYRKAAHNIRRCEIKSPIRGRISAKNVDQGEYVNIGQNLLQVSDDTGLEIPVYLNASEAAKVLPLSAVSADRYTNWFTRTAGIPVVIEWVEAPERSRWKGEVVILEDFNSETGTFKFIVKPTKPMVDKEECFPLVAGMFCKVKFEGKILKNAMLVPWVAVQLDGELFVANKSGRLEARKPTIYCSSDDALVVTSGLKDGEKLIVQKLPRGVVNGMKVNVIRPTNGRYKSEKVELVTPPQSEGEKKKSDEKSPEKLSGKRVKTCKE